MKEKNPVNLSKVKLGQRIYEPIKCGISIQEAFDIIINKPVDNNKEIYVVEEIKPLGYR